MPLPSGREPEPAQSLSWREFAAANESRIVRLEERLADHLHEYEDLKVTLARIMAELRELEDWQVEVGVYLRQLRWVVVLSAGALITGLINLLLMVNLEVHL